MPEEKWRRTKLIGSRSFTSFQMVHTHTPSRGRVGNLRSGQGDEMKLKGNEGEVKMKMRWKLLNQDAKRGTQKKREGANTNTGNLAQSGQNVKGEGKRKAEADGHRTRPAEGGRTEAPKPTYHSDTYAYLSTRRTQPTCREENTWNRGPMGD